MKIPLLNSGLLYVSPKGFYGAQEWRLLLYLYSENNSVLFYSALF